MPLLNHSDRKRARRFNTLLSKRRVKIELDFKEMKTYKVTGRFGGTRAGSRLFAWSYTFIWKKSEILLNRLEDTRRKVTVSHKYAHVLFTYWIVYRRTVILNAETKLVLVWACFCLCTWPSFSYSYHGIAHALQLVVVAKLYFQAACEICSTKKSLKTSCLLYSHVQEFYVFDHTHSLAFEDSN